MIESSVQAVAAVSYAVATVVVLGIVRRQPRDVRRYSSLVLGVVAVSAVGAVLQAYDIGTYQGALEQPQSIPRFVDDSIAYAGLFGLMTHISGASRRLVLLVAGLSVASRVAIEVGGFLGGALIVVGLFVSLGSYAARVYLLWWPVWRIAKRQHDARRLLYWKSRNTLMLLIGVAIVGGIASGQEIIDPFTNQIVIEYIDFWIRIGFAGFLLSNISALRDESVA